MYKLALEQGGSITASHGDGRIRAPYLASQFGADMYQVFEKLKKIFDPYSTLNPGVKINGNLEDVKNMMRSEYTLGHRLDHMPRS